MGAQKIAEKPWKYTLYRLDDGSVVLSVLCGGAAMYELNIPLNHGAAGEASTDESFLEKFANDIRDHPQQYVDRSINI